MLKSMPLDDEKPTFGSPVFGRLRDAAQKEWHSYTNHNFVRALGMGTLPRQTYLDYLVQDYLYLIHYARAWALLAVKCDRLDDIQQISETMNMLANTEIHLHIETCRAAGISQEQLEASEEATGTLAYTRFLTDIGLKGDALDLLVALVPCAMGYGEIGGRLAREASPDTPYKGWIDGYSSEEFENVCIDVGEMLERFAARRIGGDVTKSARWPELVRIFKTATRLEAGFWPEVEEGFDADR